MKYWKSPRSPRPESSDTTSASPSRIPVSAFGAAFGVSGGLSVSPLLTLVVVMSEAPAAATTGIPRRNRYWVSSPDLRTSSALPSSTIASRTKAMA